MKKYTKQSKEMNTFTITYTNSLGNIKTEELDLDFISVQQVSNWFEDEFGIRPRSISKH